MKTRILFHAVASTILTVGFTTHSGAATWDGEAQPADSNWQTGTNWLSNVAPVAGADLVFTGIFAVPTNTNNYPTDTSFKSISFYSDSSPFTLGGNQIILTEFISNSDDSLQTINLPLNLSGTGNHTFGTYSGDLAIGGIISGSAGILKDGRETATLSGPNTYTGGTTVLGGTLNITGSLAGGAVTVKESTTLAGSGTIGGATTIQGGGALSPTGTTLIFSNNLTFESSSIFSWDILATGTGSANQGIYDQVKVDGSLGGTGAIFNIFGANLFNSFWDTNKTWDNIYTIGSGSTLETIFTQFGGDVPADGIDPRGSFTFTGNTLNWTVVPEPTNSALVGLLLTAGMFIRRRASRQGIFSPGPRTAL